MTDYEWLTSMGICHKCRKERAAPGKKFCFSCLDKIREISAARYDPEYAKLYQARRRELYQQKKAAGICIRCSKSATHGVYCYECSIKAKRQKQKTTDRRRNERCDRGLISEERRQNGRCLWCGSPAEPGLQCCGDHRKIFSAAGKKAYETNLKNGNNPWINEVQAWKKKNNWKSSGNI